MFISQNQEKNSLQELIAEIPYRKGPVVCTGLHGSERAFLLSRLCTGLKMPICLILPTWKEVELFKEDLCFFLEKSNIPVHTFRPYNITSPFQAVPCHSQTAAARIRVLYRLAVGNIPPLLLTCVRAVRQKLIPRQALGDYAELLMTEEETDRDQLIRKLIAGGYSSAAIVEEPGDFSVRGGILDVFSPLYPDPLRIEMFGDTVESLRFFSASDQRSLENVKEAVILPAKESILYPDQAGVFINRLREHGSLAEIPLQSIRKITEQVKNEGNFPGAENLLPFLYPETDSFFDYLPENTLLILSENKDLEKKLEDEENASLENYGRAVSEGIFCPKPDQIFLGSQEIRHCLYRNRPLLIREMHLSQTGDMREGTPGDFSGEASEADSQEKDSSFFRFSPEGNHQMREELKQQKNSDFPLMPLAERINEKKTADSAVLLVCGTASGAQRLHSLLTPYGIETRPLKAFPDESLPKGRVCICIGSLSSGFVWPGESLAIITENEIFGFRRHRKKSPARKVRTELLLNFADLNIGDLVVHREQGIGRYEGLCKLKLNGSEGDFLTLLYKDEDRLYLPVERMNMVQKYMGVDGIVPVLDKMGGASWSKIRAKVKKSVEKIAGDLLKIYAARSVNRGTAFDLSGYDFQGFEAGFPYEETPDQRKVIEDVLRDMAREEPMDRLVCGDVGYGKTEVALRASFVAVNNFRQVAVLVPTTVLAEQHFETFSKRFEDFPVEIACLNRFRSPKKQKEIISGIREGKTDIVIGTHRLLQKDVHFRSLGLIVLDEEQRFGVRHKEKLKSLKNTVDVLTLTATPIPRTLHLSLMGVRDISVISTPPEDRHAIITYVSEYDEGIIAQAVRRELRRGGQIFFVHNHVATIAKTAKHLQELIPEVRADIAHGQMREADLERIMFRFMNKETDMLVCTSIVESGLDVPSANTIIVNRADRFGLAQIYQLRGRVGRAGEQAYAYLFIPKESSLTKDARKRLKVLMEHSDLGSGFRIAMNDLQIRGGGSILGASQSGHIAAVGYDMFLKLMEEAVANLKGEPVQEELEPEINIPFSAYISEDYIPDTDQRMTAYRRLSKMKSLKDISEYKTELSDRFGPLPAECTNLLLKIMLKVLAVNAGVKRLDLVGGLLQLSFSEMHQKNPFAIANLISSRKKGIEFTPDHILKARLSGKGAGAMLAQSKNILKEIAQYVNG
jgi:transcription-repair coupling factor (superfamily II helicase)